MPSSPRLCSSLETLKTPPSAASNPGTTAAHVHKHTATITLAELAGADRVPCVAAAGDAARSFPPALTVAVLGSSWGCTGRQHRAQTRQKARSGPGHQTQGERGAEGPSATSPPEEWLPPGCGVSAPPQCRRSAEKLQRGRESPRDGKKRGEMDADSSRCAGVGCERGICKWCWVGG